MEGVIKMKYRHELIVKRKGLRRFWFDFGYVIDQWINIEGETMNEIESKVDDVITIYESKYPNCSVEVRFRDVQTI